jgi:peroxiredoxin
MKTKLTAILLFVQFITINVYMISNIAYGQSEYVASKAEDIKPLAPGDIIGSISLQDTAGDKFNLNEAIKQQPAVIIFYRGGWCPYCNVHLGQLKTVEPKLQELGFQILAISPDRPAKLAESIDKQQLTYKLLSDSEMTAAKALGIAFRVNDETLKKYDEYGIDLEDASGQNHHLLPVPSVFIIGSDGVIDFSYTNPDYKVRLAPEDLLKAAKASVEHSLYDELLKQYVKDGLVDYAGLKNKPKNLNKYLKDLSHVSKDKFKSWDKNRQLAYLINLYNASTLKLIIDHYPLESIKDIGWLLKGPWDQKIVKLFGDTITLNTLEHEIIRKDYDEPRIHMALVCAAKGCPALRNKSYVGEKLDAQLDEDSKKFLNSKKGLQIDRQKKTVSLTSIFKWFGEDFINKYAPKSGFEGFNKTEQAVLNFSSRYLSEEDQAYLRAGNYSIKYLDYDWSLNEQHTKTKR